MLIDNLILSLSTGEDVGTNISCKKFYELLISKGFNVAIINLNAEKSNYETNFITYTFDIEHTDNIYNIIKQVSRNYDYVIIDTPSKLCDIENALFSTTDTQGLNIQTSASNDDGRTTYTIEIQKTINYESIRKHLISLSTYCFFSQKYNSIYAKKFEKESDPFGVLELTKSSGKKFMGIINIDEDINSTVSVMINTYIVKDL